MSKTVAGGSALSAFGLALALAAPGAAAAATPILWAKAGADGAEMAAKLDECTIASRSVRADVEPIPIYRPGSIAIGLSEWIESEIRTPKAQAAARDRCLFRGGYRAVRLTPAESADLASQQADVARVAWIDAFYQRSDFAARLSSASPQPLPEAAPEPLTYGAVRFNPANLHAATGSVRAGGALIEGSVTYRRTAVLVADASFELNGQGLMKAGSMLHQVRFAGQGEGPASFWCGPYLTMGLTLQACVRSVDDGYQVFVAEGAGWLATGLDIGEGQSVTTDVFTLTADRTPPPPLGFSLVLKSLGKDTAALEAQLDNGRDGETLWGGTVRFDADGRALLPFWTHALILTRSGSAVSATFAPGGDGLGFPG